MFKNGENRRLMDKCKIVILNIDSILDWIILSPKNMEVLNFASPKSVYMLKSVKKWLCKTSWITPPFLSFEKKLLLQYFFYELMFSNPKFQMIWMKIDWIIEHSCLVAILNFSVISFSFYGLYYQNMSLIAHGTIFSYNCSPISRFW
jgi:hypothetical protein